MSADEISLTLPADDAFRRVTHLVLGGFAGRLDVTYDNLEDLELALDALLERSTGDGDVTVRVRLEGGELCTVVGPLDAQVLGELEREAGSGIDLRRILDTTCDRIEVTGDSVELAKRLGGER